MREALQSSLRARLGGLLARPALRGVAARLDPAEYGAQPLLGVDGYAFIGHGSSDARAVASALRTASRAVAAGALLRDDVIAREGERYIVVDSLLREWVARQTY